jgi:hypothetical protein
MLPIIRCLTGVLGHVARVTALHGLHIDLVTEAPFDGQPSQFAAPESDNTPLRMPDEHMEVQSAPPLNLSALEVAHLDAQEATKIPDQPIKAPARRRIPRREISCGFP